MPLTLVPAVQALRVREGALEDLLRDGLPVPGFRLNGTLIRSEHVVFIGCKPLVSAPAGFTHLGPSVATAALSFWSCSLVQPRPVDSLFFTMGGTECDQLLDQSAGNSLC